MSLLETSQLTVRFGGLTAVNAVDLRVELREIFSIIGPNGAGKTTIFNAITGIYEPTTGHVRLTAGDLCRTANAKTWLGIGLIALLTGIGFLLAVNIESLWETVITANYQYQQPFPWPKAVTDFTAYFATRSLWPALIGGVIGGSGAWMVWRRTRRAPEVAARCGIARTFQNVRLFKQMTALENVLLGMDTQLQSRFWDDAFRLPRHWRERAGARKLALATLQFVGLESQADQRADCLAYGHQRRLEIARALASNPKLLLLDEPAAGMNPSEADDLMQLIRRIRDRGITVLLIEHHMRVVMGISDRIAVLDHGEKIAEGTPAEVCGNAKVVEAYLGKSHATG